MSSGGSPANLGSHSGGAVAKRLRWLLSQANKMASVAELVEAKTCLSSASL